MCFIYLRSTNMVIITVIMVIITVIMVTTNVL
jgi:hypothetical protein